MAQDCIRSAGEHAGHPPTVRAEHAVPDGIDAPVDPVQPPARHPPVDRRLAQAERDQLSMTDYAVLPPSEIGHRSLT
jgi:hypothetical protein